MIERAPNDYEQAKILKMRISALKAELIGLTQQYDRISGNTVAERMIVTVDVVPSPIQPALIRGGSEEYDPIARRRYKLSRDIR